MTKTATSIALHFQKLRELHEREAAFEKKQFLEGLSTAENSAYSLRNLEILDEEGGLGGRSILILKRKGRGSLPWTNLDAGSPVFLSSEDPADKFALRGIVSERGEHSIAVVFEETPAETEDIPLYRLDLAYDENSRKRERSALDRSEAAAKNALAHLRDILLGLKEATFSPPDTLDFLNPNLNETQKEAIQFALSANELAIVHGPPGTGKTTTLVEIIRQSVARGQRILVCAPSNLGVDNVLEKLTAAGERAVRIGHPARVMPGLRQHSLDYLVESHEDTRLARKMQKEAAELFRLAHRYTRSPPPKGARQNLRQEARSLLNDARNLEARAVQRVLASARIVCATLSGVESFTLARENFDCVVIDEAGQATEPASWIPLSRAPKLVLGGDHQQLPPTILCPEAAALGISLMERLSQLYQEKVTRRLLVQYRMHEKIMAFSSQEFYGNSLIAADCVKTHQLRDLPKVIYEGGPLQFIDTAGAAFSEGSDSESGSRFNRKEADLINRKLQELQNLGLDPASIAVISPYAAQVRLLRDEWPESKIEIDTVDGFQGREKEAVLLTLVRSNEDQEVGFLGELRRMNVALTRARRLLIVVGDSATLGALPFYQRLLQYWEDAGAYCSVWEDAPELIG